jgi:hypothetical protein
MKTNNKISMGSIALAVMLALSVAGLTSCEEKGKTYSGDPYFMIEGDPTGLSATLEATSASFTVRSNRPWKVVAKSEQTWVKAFPEEGDEDGIFKIIITKNTRIDARTADFAFVVEEKEQPTLFRVEQEAHPPFLSASTMVPVIKQGGTVTVSVDANVDWNHSLTGGSWLTELEVTPAGLLFQATPNNTGEAREALLEITPVLPEYIALAATVTVRQESEQTDDGKATGYVYLDDKFDWVIPFNGPRDIEEYNETGDAVVTGTLNMYTYPPPGGAAGDLRNAFIAEGYTDINAAQQSLYFASHYVKFGKTNVQTGIQRNIPDIDAGKATNVLLTFDATPCITGSKNFDQVLLIVELDGPGSVGVDDAITKTSPELDIQLTNGAPVWEWKPQAVVLYGVTANTKVTIKTNKSGAADGTFRWYMDNLKFAKHSTVTP